MSGRSLYGTNKNIRGFTIVELLIVIVVIAILAAITAIAFTGIQQRAAGAALQSDLKNASTQLAVSHADDGSYPAGSTPPSNLDKSQGTTYQYDSDGTTYCLTATSDRSGVSAYSTSNTSGVTEGACAGHSETSGNGGSGAITDGSHIQTITDANCPTTRTRSVDARDNHTYWVQRLADGKCWMLTNLGYAGGGTNTYSDTKTLTNGTGGSTTYTTANYYVPTGANVTTEPTNPSISTTGTGQYGYLYNWCGAMGNQQGTSACLSAATPVPSTSISVCPAGWRLPVGIGGEFTTLNSAINSGSSSSDTGLLANPWLAQRSGYWGSGFGSQDSSGYYWSSSQYSASVSYSLVFNSSTVNRFGMINKYYGSAVRCVAS